MGPQFVCVCVYITRCNTVLIGYPHSNPYAPSVKPRCKHHDTKYCDAFPADAESNPDYEINLNYAQLIGKLSHLNKKTA